MPTTALDGRGLAPDFHKAPTQRTVKKKANSALTHCRQKS